MEGAGISANTSSGLSCCFDGWRDEHWHPSYSARLCFSISLDRGRSINIDQEPAFLALCSAALACVSSYFRNAHISKLHRLCQRSLWWSKERLAVSERFEC